MTLIYSSYSDVLSVSKGSFSASRNNHKRTFQSRSHRIDDKNAPRIIRAAVICSHFHIDKPGRLLAVGRARTMTGERPLTKAVWAEMSTDKGSITPPPTAPPPPRPSREEAEREIKCWAALLLCFFVGFFFVVVEETPIFEPKRPLTLTTLDPGFQDGGL